MAETTPLLPTTDDLPLGPKANGHSISPKSTEESPAATPKRPPRPKKPNYAYIHRNALPLQTYPLPAFHPTNPVSLLRLAYSYLSALLSSPQSHPDRLYSGYFDVASRSVHVTNLGDIHALWEMGFFGKGTLSRSEPSWLERERARREIVSGRKVSGFTAEEATRKRRDERRAFKLERARLEAEKVKLQRDVEEGKVVEDEEDEQAGAGAEALNADQVPQSDDAEHQAALNATAQARVPDADLVAAATMTNNTTDQTLDELDNSLASMDLDKSDITIEPETIEPQEYFQLTLEEAFFLAYGLGVLSVLPAPDTSPISYSTSDLLPLFASHAAFPPLPLHEAVAPDNAFLLSYVVYHHFRSLGWVVRPGTKFGCDWLLYNRGPVFSHAEFAVIILPAYSHPSWSTPDGIAAGKKGRGEGRDWWWLHCVNRVQSQVKKSLVLVYVEVPPPAGAGEAEATIGERLSKYKVREFVLRRWLMNRSRG